MPPPCFGYTPPPPRDSVMLRAAATVGNNFCPVSANSRFGSTFGCDSMRVLNSQDYGYRGNAVPLRPRHSHRQLPGMCTGSTVPAPDKYYGGTPTASPWMQYQMHK